MAVERKPMLCACFRFPICAGKKKRIPTISPSKKVDMIKITHYNTVIIIQQQVAGWTCYISSTLQACASLPDRFFALSDWYNFFSNPLDRSMGNRTISNISRQRDRVRTHSVPSVSWFDAESIGRWSWPIICWFPWTLWSPFLDRIDEGAPRWIW